MTDVNARSQNVRVEGTGATCLKIVRKLSARCSIHRIHERVALGTCLEPEAAVRCGSCPDARRHNPMRTALRRRVE
eukprot:3780223-Rhodomonas_salina.1